MKISPFSRASNHFRVLIIGGGAAGCGASHKFARRLKKNEVAVIEPSKTHYYQPGFTLVGGGLMPFESTQRAQRELVHPNSTWIQEAVDAFDPNNNSVTLTNGDKLTYKFLVIATGLQLRFDLVKGLEKALTTPGVCSNYSPQFCQKTYQEAMAFKGGNAVFTFPNTPLKCPGAPQKAAYITDDILRKRGVREKAHIIYVTSLPQIFGVLPYVPPLQEIAKDRGIDVRIRQHLVEVNTEKRIATFEHLDENAKPTGRTLEVEYAMLHVGPPQSPIEPLRKCKELTDAAGFVDVNPVTLQSTRFANIFAVGDCANSNNIKTAAAISSHLNTLEQNLGAALEGKTLPAKADGYSSCPLVVSCNRVLLAEFNPQGKRETLPIDQSNPRYLFYWMKRYFFPFLYWQGLVKGHWNGPANIRKVLRFGRD